MRFRDLAVNLGMLVIIIALVAIGDVRSSDRAREACLRDAYTANYIRGAARRGLKSLATIAYYREHPGELARAKRQLREQIKAFPPLNC